MSETHCYMVHWKARVLISDHSIHNGLITQVRPGGFSMEFIQALATGSNLSIEFHAKYKGIPRRFRANTKVTRCTIKSRTVGATLNLSILKMAKQDHHAMNNILHILGDSDEFDLRS